MVEYHPFHDLPAAHFIAHHRYHMSLLNWIRGRNGHAGNRAGGKDKARRSFSQTTLPLISPRRGRRILRREQLFGIVRECMIRGGVLSTSYEFKVLALDANADKFLVLVDLALPAETMPSEYLLEIERWVQQSARSRHAMEVPAIYWRRKPSAEQRGTALRASMASQTRNDALVKAGPGAAQTATPVQPVDADEVRAFRQALAQPPQPWRGPRANSDDGLREPVPEAHSDFTALSDTQYGRL